MYGSLWFIGAMNDGIVEQRIDVCFSLFIGIEGGKSLLAGTSIISCTNTNETCIIDLSLTTGIEYVS